MIHDKLFNDTINKFGVQHQLDKLIEEMGELQTAIIKYRRGMTIANEDNLHEEFIDVMIVAKQIETVLNKKLLEYWEKEKINRLTELVYGKS